MLLMCCCSVVYQTTRHKYLEKVRYFTSIVCDLENCTVAVSDNIVPNLKYIHWRIAIFRLIWVEVGQGEVVKSVGGQEVIQLLETACYLAGDYVAVLSRVVFSYMC